MSRKTWKEMQVARSLGVNEAQAAALMSSRERLVAAVAAAEKRKIDEVFSGWTAQSL
jgi:hypothetical protein